MLFLFSLPQNSGEKANLCFGLYHEVLGNTPATTLGILNDTSTSIITRMCESNFRYSYGVDISAIQTI